jgi:3-hydroxyacyl-CoA dehydrogenase
MDLKLGFYSKLGGIAKPSAIFASNTSSLQITAMGEASKRPDRFIGLHFFNPVQLMKLVEIIRTNETSNATYDAVAAYAQKIKKTSVTTPDTPGFIVNRLLVPYMSQAMLLLDNKIATVRDIDVAMQLGAGHPMGPLHLADYVGLDTCLSILSGWKKNFPGEAAFVVPKVLEEKVKAGHFGRKTGKGFYNWNGDKVGEPVV